VLETKFMTCFFIDLLRVTIQDYYFYIIDCYCLYLHILLIKDKGGTRETLLSNSYEMLCQFDCQKLVLTLSCTKPELILCCYDCIIYTIC